MALVEERDLHPNLVRADLMASRLESEREEPETDPLGDLTDDERAKLKILRYCASLYDDARKARDPYETFDTAWELFNGNPATLWRSGWGRSRPRITINKIRAFITFMQAVMTDNKPRISVEPLVPGSEDAADLLRKLVDRDWDENDMQQKVATFVLYGLIWGTGFMKVTFDPRADGGRGRHIATPVVPYRIFTNRTATCIEDCEYIIHVEEQTMGWVRRNFPDRAAVVDKVRGLQSLDNRDRDRDYIREGDGSEAGGIINAQKIAANTTPPMYANNGNAYNDDDGDVVEIAEYWLRDESLESYERQKIVNGVLQTTEKIDPETGLYEMEVVGQQIAVSPLDGMPFLRPITKPKRVPVMENAWREKFPNGRLVVVAGGRVLLRDIPNPFQTDGFPFAMWKDYDVGSFWGQGEPLALKDPQIALNRIVSQVYHILEKIGSPSFKLDKKGGINKDAIRDKPGLIIPMDDMKALEPLEKPAIPPQFMELYGLLNGAMGDINGVNDSVRGNLPGGNTAFATIDQLQESGAAPIRLKVRNLETGLGRIGKLRVQLIQQYDSGERPLRERIERPPQFVAGEDGEEPVVVPSAGIAEVKFRAYTKGDLQGPVEYRVEPISSLSTSPAGLWNRWLQMYDKKLVDRRWWHTQNRINGWKSELPRMEQQEAMMAQAKAQAKEKPGPKPSRPARAGRKPTAPPSALPTRLENNAVR